MHVNEISEKFLGACFEVSNVLGSGFNEQVYENSLMEELGLRGLRARNQVPLEVSYKGKVVGEFRADIIAEEELLVELKAVKAMTSEMEAQCHHYLKATGMKVCLLINFGTSRIGIKRLVHEFEG